ncbi:hypothetical protein [Roseofilum casamattae]|uniref:Uncharacterized protein n=1 Tax=Roseofilum casamattae BLCC-M143 TaxID=3022442 RepID=A0ABT7BST6_9CYAN|nr:hypothetical protein [Roseofilum casamattae]MDJ1182253.1 hypothetical protein [Roseofilum casamattae BLCC-M143]
MGVLKTIARWMGINLHEAASVKQSARYLLDYHKKLYSQPHEFIIVDARDFVHLNLRFYDRTQEQLESLGFEKLADIEDVTMSEADRTKLPVLTRVMLSRDRRTVASIFIIPGGPRIVALESEFPESTFLVTNNTLGFNASLPIPEIEYLEFPRNTSIPELVKYHCIRIQALNANTPALIIRDFDEAIAMEHRLQTLKNNYQKARGYLTREDIERHAKFGQKGAAEILGDAVEALKAKEAEENNSND